MVHVVDGRVRLNVGVRGCGGSRYGEVELNYVR